MEGCNLGKNTDRSNKFERKRKRRRNSENKQVVLVTAYIYEKYVCVRRFIRISI